MKTYKVHLINEETGNSQLLFSGNEKEARKFYVAANQPKGYQLELSVTFCGSTTLINWK